MGRRIADTLLVLASVIALGSTAVAFWSASHWPLVGDSALMRYVVLLLQAGREPYRQIIDINLPGSYLLEACAMHVLGAGAWGLRLYDGLLCLIACAGAIALSEKSWRSRLCGLLAGLLFTAIHLRDGLVQAGERDLAMAAIVLAAYATLLRWPRRLAGLLLFELLIGLTLTIKPTLAPLALLPVLQSRLRTGEFTHSARTALLGLGALLLPVLAMFLSLAHFHAIGSFLHVLRTIDATHTGLAHPSVFALLAHALQPVPVLFVIATVLLLRLRKIDVEERLLLAGIACGLLSLFVQEKGFPYQRYPFLLLSLVLLGQLLARALETSGSDAALAAGTVAFAGLWLLPSYAATVHTYDAEAPTEAALAHDLTMRHVSSGTVQCLDTVGGCINTLYNLRLLQSTGFLYDCYAYAGSEFAQMSYRNDLLAAVSAARPQTIVLTDQFCLGELPRTDRVARWPELAAWLDRNYRADGSWQPTGKVLWWHQPERPTGYILYTRK